NADGRFSLKGTGTPGSKVEVWADGKLLGSTTVGTDGTWSLDADLPAGKHTLTTRTVDASGKVLAESAPMSWEAPALAAVAPVLTLPEQPNADGRFSLKGTGTPGSKVEVWADGKLLGSTTVGTDGAWSLDADLPAGKHTLTTRTVDASGKVLAESAPMSWEALALAAVAPTLTLPEKLEAGKSVKLSGTGTPGTEVEIVEDGKVIGKATVGADGTWTYSYTPSAGEHTLLVRAAGDATLASAPAKLSMPASASAPAPVTLPAAGAECGVGEDRGTTYVVAQCEYMALIANRVGVTLAALIAANPEVTNPDLIYPGQILNLPPR
ncbi:MAG: LysM peptidoglycan-binding domain-containing protein, partial [Anaerolineae bacterium]|nr:LysM peptidoglycan-binding domain-containing protein [Anaerolineae bacterium]